MATTGPLFRGINVVSISVTDLDRARAFYGEVLGFGPPLYDLPEAGWIEFSTGGVAGNVSVTLAESGWTPSTGTTLVLNVEDCHAAVEELRRRGARMRRSFPASSPLRASTIPSAIACRCAARLRISDQRAAHRRP
ncbi:hypothetical protein SAMCFNEI73_Ch3330 [Sinorhizobium americanum]|uniref:Glyoxalase/fosfomycin resistance/dioxygenase domain-containing protein n=2 Tax=Sinorhizobium americanum TaxID=194963 RepID=A0A1L3LR67_9HYPH|nr:hypothetical protein SAMCCGM7_Ch3208 [Sinorhizobium americanum CCGM7]APG92592.1 hypothetical protein SAMCFNEI73_Ch3330 [Sinorhizobium americanum]